MDEKSNSISVSYLRGHLAQVFHLMKDAGVTLRVSHHRKIYNLHITPTSDRVVKQYRKSKMNPTNKIDPSLISSKKCPECKELMLNGLCMNKECQTNSPAL